MDETSRGQVDLIREAFYYQSRFDGETMVFKIDFPVTEEPTFPYLMRDLALLSQTGIRVVIIPGAKQWIDSVLTEYDINCTYSGGLRITSAEAIPFVKMAAFDVATRFMTEFSANHIDAVIGNFLRARGLGVVDGVDFLHSGRVERILVEPLAKVLDLGMVPILPCIGWSGAGKSYNLASDEIALAACTALKAVKLFIVSADRGIHMDEFSLPTTVHALENGRLARLTPAEAEQFLARNSSPSRALEELALALKASRAGVERVHIVDGRVDGAILRELFSNLGVGTMVYADEYESIRELRPADIGEVLRLMEDSMQKGILLRRTAEDLLECRENYVVYDIDDSVHACGALYDWGEGQAEVAAIAADAAYSDLSLGRRIVHYLIDRARRQGFKRVFALTTATHDWFEILGFHEADLGSLPVKKQEVYDRKRKSKIFALELV